MALQEQTFPIQPIVKAHFIINCVIVTLTLLVVALRMTSRFITSASLWWDDFLILLSMPQGIGMLVIQGLCKQISFQHPSCGCHLTQDRHANGRRLPHN